MNRDRFWTIGIAGGIAVVLVLGWVIGISPIVAQAADADAQHTSIQRSNEASRSSIAVLKSEFAGIGKLTAQLDGLTGSIPVGADIPVFLRELDGLSNAHNVGLTNVVVSPATNYVAPVVTAPASTATGSSATPSPTPSPSASAGAVAAAPAVPAGAAGRLVLIPVTIGVSGGYTDIMAFVGGLQSGARLYLVSTLHVTGTVDDPLAYTGDLTGYVYALPLPAGVTSLAKSVTPTPSPTPTGIPTPDPSRSTAP